MPTLRVLRSTLLDRGLVLARGKFVRLFVGTFMMAVFSGVVALGMAVLLARELGPADYGQFAFALNTATLAAQLSGLGLPMLANKLFSELEVQERWEELKGFGRASVGLTIAASLGAAGLLFGASFYGGMSEEIATGLALSAILVVPIALRLLRRRQLASVRKPAVGLFIDEGFAPACLVISLVAVGTLGLAYDLVLFGVASLFGATMGALLVSKAMPEQIKVRGLESRYCIGAWLGASIPMMLGMSSRLIINRTDILLVAPLLSMEEVGYFGAAMRLTYALTLPQVILNTVVAPMLSEAYAEGKFVLLKRRFNGAMLFALVTALPLALAIWWLREPLIVFTFGNAFAPSADILALLVISQLAVGLSLPCSSLLMMTGNERAFAIEGLFALIVNVILCLYLIPQYGSIGAAMALCGSSGAFFLTQFWLSRRVMFRLSRVVVPLD